MEDYLNDPQKIESLSFKIIGEELAGNQPPEEVRDIVYRVIHATADMEYARLLEFKNDPLKAASEAFSEGCGIYADTSMIAHGVNAGALGRCGSTICNYVHDNDVTRQAKESGRTRSSVALEKAAHIPNLGVYAIGNAPTALLRLVELVKSGELRPKLIIGVPVGFVNAVESKEALSDLDGLGVPYIRTNGRKGGSTVAAAIINSLLYRQWR